MYMNNGHYSLLLNVCQFTIINYLRKVQGLILKCPLLQVKTKAAEQQQKNSAACFKCSSHLPLCVTLGS